MGSKKAEKSSGKFRIHPQMGLNFDGEITVDNFAGGGGASTGIEAGQGRPVDIAVNHDPVAIAMHEVNHPHTLHLCESVWDVDPVKVCAGRPVGRAWFSPDCTHHSKARGGKPRDKNIRGLAWVALRWAALVRPREIYLENVEEFVTWGPLCPEGQPIAGRKGETFRAFVGALSTGIPADHPAMDEIRETLGTDFPYRVLETGLGYEVDHRELRACDYGAPTIRKRLFLVARCDGRLISWPEPTHGDPKSRAVKEGRLKPWRTAAECIDWSIPCPSIFERKKPLAEATLRRIAKGVMRYVVESPEPFIVSYYGEKKGDRGRGQKLREPLKTQTTENRFALVTPFITEHANSSNQRNMPADGPLRTVCAQVKGGHSALVAPHMIPLTHHGDERTYGMVEPFRTVTGANRGEQALISSTLIQTGYGERPGQAPRVPGLDKPLGTVVAGGGKHALVSTFLAKHYGGVVGVPVDGPAGTITTIDHHSLVAAHMVRSFGESIGSHPEAPVGTITAGGMGKTGVVAANLVRNFGKSAGADPNEPACTVTGKSKDSLVTSHLVKLRGTCQDGQPVTEPAPTITAGGLHVGEVRAFLMKYYGTDQDPNLQEPLHTVTTKDRFGLVTVRGVEYQIVDIGMRMLAPRELYRAQGFPETYIIDRTADGRPITKTEQVAKCGNSVCPPVAEALIRANMTESASERKVA